MISKAKLSDRLQFSVPGNWVPVSTYRRFACVGVLENADAAETLTVQLRKATDAAGTNAANHGAAVVVNSTAADVDLTAVADADAAELGSVGGVAFTHVTAVITDSGDTEVPYGVVIRGDGRFNP